MKHSIDNLVEMIKELKHEQFDLFSLLFELHLSQLYMDKCSIRYTIIYLGNKDFVMSVSEMSSKYKNLVQSLVKSQLQ